MSFQGIQKKLDEKNQSVRNSTEVLTMTATTSSQRNHIESVPGRCGGKPCIVGTRIRVQDIVLFTEDGMKPEEIANEFSQISLADIHAALAYYYDNAAAINQDIREDSEFVAKMKGANGPSLLGELK